MNTRGDMISDLPRPLRHHIFSYLPIKDVVRTRILSKKWNKTSTSFAIPYFCFGRGGIMWEQDPDTFLVFVRKSLQGQLESHGSISEFKLSMQEAYRTLPYPSRLEDCIQLAVQNKVKELDIKLEERGARLIMPETLFSAKELTLLSLSDSHLSILPTHGVPTWPILLKLCLERCHVDGQILQNLSCCPLLESLFLRNCDQLQDLNLSGLTKLTEVGIVREVTDTRDITVQLYPPSLKIFTLSSGGGLCNVDLTACKKITKLDWNYFSPMFSTNDLADLIAGLPALQILRLHLVSDRIRLSSKRVEHLHLSVGGLSEIDLTDLIAGLHALQHLSLESELNRIKVSSQQLEKLDLTDSVLLSEVSIDAPSLKTFVCSSNFLSSYQHFRRQRQAVLVLGRSRPEEVTIKFFLFASFTATNLREFLADFKAIKLVMLYINRGRMSTPTPMEIQFPWPLPNIKHLRIVPGDCIANPTTDECVGFLNSLLWSCHPECISMDLSTYGTIMNRVFSEELLEIVRDPNRNMYHHGLRSFEMKVLRRNAETIFNGTDAYAAMRDLLPTADASEVEVHFMLKW